MVLVDRDLGGMLEEIGFSEVIRDDKLTLEGGINRPYNEYLPNLLRELFPNRNYLYFISMALALENAFLRGNQMQPQLPVSLKVFSGRYGYVISISDSGHGFDYKEKIHQMRVGDSSYANGLGRGLKRLDQVEFPVSYNGNTVSIIIKR